MIFSITWIFLTFLVTCKSEIDTNDLDLHDISNLLSDLDIPVEDLKRNNRDHRPRPRKSSKYADRKYYKINKNEHQRKRFKKNGYEPEEVKNLLYSRISYPMSKYSQTKNLQSSRSYDIYSPVMKNEYETKSKLIQRDGQNYKSYKQKYYSENQKSRKKERNQNELKQPALEQQRALIQHQEFETRMIFEHQRLLENQRLFREQHQKALEQERALEDQRLLGQNQQQRLQQQARDIQQALELQNQRLIQQHNQEQQRMLQEQRALAQQQQAVRQQRLQQQQAILLHHQQAIQQQRLIIQKRNQFLQQQARSQKPTKYSNYQYE